MSQSEVWEKEYRNPKLVTNSNEPQLDFKHYIKWLRKSAKVNLDGLRVLDLGSGTGKNSIFLAERGSVVTGIEISNTAIKLAEERAAQSEENPKFIKGNIGAKLTFDDNSFDLILDVVSSNSLNESERSVYAKEIHRVLKPGGHIFVKALCKDGDKNALNLLERFPGSEQDTYIMPETLIVERVFTKEGVEQLYTGFEIKLLERKSSYTQFEGKSYKRNFWLLYLQKPAISV